MPRDYRVYLDDILEAVARIREYTAGLGFAGFAQDRKTLDAVVRNLEIVGEAVKGVPPTIRDQCPGIEWKKIAGLRDILVHEYFGINVEMIWDIVQNKVPVLEQQVRKMCSDESAE